MERLREIQLLELGAYSVSLAQLISVIVVALLSFLVYWLLERKLITWYYGRETTSVKNQERMRRAVRFTILGVFTVLFLRILDIDYGFEFILEREELTEAEQKAINEALKEAEMNDPDAANDTADVSNGLKFELKISYLIQVLIAYIVANLLDTILSEIVTQRYFRRKNAAAEQNLTISSDGAHIRWLRPVLMTLVVILFANETNLALYAPFEIPTGPDSSIAITIGRMLHAVLVFFLVNLLLTFITSFVLKGYFQRRQIDTGSQFAINRLLTYFAYVIGVLLVIQAAGFNLIGIWTGAAALLVGIGIGLQQTFNDLICGIIILFERSVKVGDVVELTGHQVGTVRKVGARTSILETRDDVTIFVPNSKLIGENVVNWSQVERKARFHVGVGVAYGSDTALVKEILTEVAKAHDRTLDSPPPFVRFLDFGDSSLNFEVIFWSRDFMRIEDTKSDIRFGIDAAFRARGVEIPFPQRDLWIRGGLPAVGTGQPEVGADAGATTVGKAEPDNPPDSSTN